MTDTGHTPSKLGLFLVPSTRMYLNAGLTYPLGRIGIVSRAHKPYSRGP